MININKKENCSGCSACCSVCPVQCIQMKEDSEGFLYPFVDSEKCIHCGKCESVCPVLNDISHKTVNEIKKAYVVQNTDPEILKESTSGGFFTALAESVLDRNGIVIGAAYNDEYRICHRVVETKEDLRFLRNSKYTQSEICDMFHVCKKKLQENIPVCFSGTPCQIAGLKAFLGKEYDHLITVDVVCHGVPSPLLFQKYIEWCGGAESLADVRFRDKHYGYFSSTMGLYWKNGKVKRRELHSDPMLHFFFSNICSRPSCYVCRFKTVDRVSDFTMFDCWHAARFSDQFGNRGATAVIARNQRAEQLMKQLLEKRIQGLEVDLATVVALDGVMITNSVPVSKHRTEFFEVLNSDTFENLLKKYGEHGAAHKIKKLIKSFLFRSGLFDYYISKKMK